MSPGDLWALGWRLEIIACIERSRGEGTGRGVTGTNYI